MIMIWYRLVKAGRGEDLTRMTFVMVDDDTVVAKLCMVVHAGVGGEAGAYLRRFAPSDFAVFADRDAFDREREMDVYEPLKGVGDARNPVIIQVPWPRWKPLPEPAATLAAEELHFVNRDDAVEKLCEVHRSVYVAAHKGGRGDSFKIALADNELGLGKTVFGLNYIRRCNEKWPLTISLPEFQDSLSSARTIRVVIQRAKFMKAKLHGTKHTTLPDALAEVVNSALAKAVKAELAVGSSVPEYLTSPSAIADTDFVTKIVKDLGPIFIVLDEIGHGFRVSESDDDDDDEDESRKLFNDFCSSVLHAWMNMKGVYFVLLGYASFLRNVGERKDTLQHSSSPFRIVRLNLQLIRPPKIKEIIQNTYVDLSKTETLATRWKLETDSDVENAARIMYNKTCGHPRTMMSMFQGYKTFADFCKADVDPFVGGDGAKAWATVYRELRTWQPLVKRWLPSILGEVPVNLSDSYPCPHGSDGLEHSISMVTIAERCHLGWEGNVYEAKMYALPRILAAILLMVYRLRDYLRSVETNIHKVTLAYPTVFEWTCLKRFQELFNEPTSPSTALPSFFGADTVFGKLSGVQFDQAVLDSPKITNGAKADSQPSLDSATALPTQWRFLMGELNQKIEKSSTASVCLKPLPQSASPDLILMHRTKSGKKRPHAASPQETALPIKTLTVGIAVKNYSTSKFGPRDLRDECHKFAAMFSHMDKKMKKKFGAMTNVLVVCATGYSDGFANEFEGKSYFRGDAEADIDEVLLLDLTTPEKRAEFFGLTHGSHLARVLEELLNKTERERDQSLDGFEDAST